MDCRDYQRDLKNDVYRSWEDGNQNVIAVLPTGGGKTFVFSSIIHEMGVNTWVIAHRQELVIQISMALAREGVHHNVIAPSPLIRMIIHTQVATFGTSFVSHQSRVAVAGVDTLLRRKDQHAREALRTQLWVQDECFSAGTLVDGKPVETVKVGDVVTCFNQKRGTFHLRPVTHVFKSIRPENMVRIHYGHHVIKCTENHPFWTPGGWVDAGELTSDDYLYVVQQETTAQWIRVDRVEIYKPDDTGHVYNLEVEEFHTYLANDVVVHNCHHLLRTNKWGKVLDGLSHAKGLGVTATPHRADGKGLGRHAEGLFDAMVVGPNMRDLIDRGYLSDYRVFVPPSDFKVDGIKTSADGDYNKKQLADAAKRSHIVGDVVDHYKRIADCRRGVTFATSVESATDIASAYNQTGVPAAVIHAKTKDEVRQDAIRRLKDGELLQLVNVDIFGEGFDLPAIEVCSMARPTKSYGLYAQQFGRALRIMEGKDHALIIDHVSNVIRHGLPDAARQWSLDGTKGSPRQVSDEIPMRACPECTQVYLRTQKECPHCGYYPEPESRSEPEFVDGDLTELTSAALARLRVATDLLSPADVIDMMHRQRAPEIAARGAANKIAAKHEARAEVREALEWFGGYQEQVCKHSQSEAYRLFYHLFGTDVLSAQTGTAAEMKEMAARINTYLLDKEAVRIDDQKHAIRLGQSMGGAC